MNLSLKPNATAMCLAIYDGGEGFLLKGTLAETVAQLRNGCTG